MVYILILYWEKLMLSFIVLMDSINIKLPLRRSSKFLLLATHACDTAACNSDRRSQRCFQVLIRFQSSKSTNIARVRYNP
jgi:hypothetical protein